MSAEPCLSDANVLVYALYAEAEYHVPRRSLLESASSPDPNLCVTSQVLAEFFSTVTSPKRVTVARSPVEASNALRTIIAMPGISVLPTTPDTPLLWLDLVITHPVTGGGIFDLQLAATMISNKVRKLYTYNTTDFASISEVEAISPP